MPFDDPAIGTLVIGPPPPQLPPIDTVPAVPTNLVATPGDTTVLLGWSDNIESDFDSYRIYQATASGGPYVFVAASIISEYTITGLANGTQYWFKVSALDDTDNESAQTSSVTTTPVVPDPLDVTAPAVPTGLAATAGNLQVVLNWDNNSESDLANYKVYRATASGGPYTLVTTRNPSDYINTGLTNGTTYWFKVSALDATGNESAQSSSANATPAVPTDTTPPAVPTGLTATPGNGIVTLNWDNSPTSDWANFKVYRSPSSGGVYTHLVTRTASDYINTGLSNGVPYFYKVSAVDLTGNESAQSSAVNATPTAAADTTPPPVPTGLTAVAGNGQVVLNWSDSPATDILNFRIYRALSSGGTYTFIVARTASDFINTSLTNGTTYFYKVSAVDTTGNESAQTAFVSATPAAAPTGVVLWVADMETGNLGQWTGFSPTGQGRAELVTSPVHGGSYAMALHCNATGGASTAIRAREEDNIYGPDPNNLPPDGYFSVWLRTPQKLNPVNNVFQWKQGYRHALVTHTGQTDYNKQTRLLLHFIRLDWISADNNHQLMLRTKINQATGAWAGGPGEAGTSQLANSGALRVNLNQWHHIECRYKFDETKNGRITSWLDGVQWCDVQNIYTELRLIQVGGQPVPGATTYVTKPRSWTVNNYMTEGAGAWDPEITVIYFDDAKIATSQVGP